ncbi:MAG: glutamate--tRNA ligase, partial [Fibrobacterota bacterium]
KDRESIVFFDTIRGKEISRPIEEVDDQVLIKADGFPTYHMANVVDDHLMEITHVIRGEEWINSTPKHVLLYEAFGWKMPVFAHLSLLRNADKNKSKVSKRKNPVSLTWFRAAGYTREAVLNFLGLMAYHFKGDDEVFSVREMVENFSFENFSTSSPVFDLVKLGDLNARYIRSMDDESFVSYCSGRAKYALSYLKPLLPMIRQRTNAEIPYNTWTDMFFRVSLDYDAGALVPKGIDKGGVLKMLKDMKKKLSKSEAASAADFESLAGQYKEETGIKTKPFMMALRVALTGSAASLPLWESLEIMGKDAAARRLGEAADFLASAR